MACVNVKLQYHVENGNEIRRSCDYERHHSGGGGHELQLKLPSKNGNKFNYALCSHQIRLFVANFFVLYTMRDG